ncbi:hypothetical protein [Sphingorhabdus sp. YGSMI21]|nr:hypothetical protein [Sphingorhabdus sp. YGSMI21]
MRPVKLWTIDFQQPCYREQFILNSLVEFRELAFEIYMKLNVPSHGFI